MLLDYLLTAKSLQCGMFPGFAGFMLFPPFQATPPVNFSDAERDAGKLLFILAARAATLLLLRATPPAEPPYSSVCFVFSSSNVERHTGSAGAFSR